MNYNNSMSRDSEIGLNQYSRLNNDDYELSLDEASNVHSEDSDVNVSDFIDDISSDFSSFDEDYL